MLSESEIVAAALRVIKDDGVAGLSMRRLSRELGVSAMAPYHYLADKNDLLSLVIEAVLSEVELPTKAADPWDVRLRVIIDRVDDQIRRHPGIAQLLLERMLSAHAPLLEAVLELLLDAGFDERSVLMAFSLLHTYLYGRHQVRMVVPPADDGEQLPVIGQLSRHLDTVSGRDFYAFGIDTIIAGLTVQLAAQQPRPGSPATRGGARNARGRAAP